MIDIHPEAVAAWLKEEFIKRNYEMIERLNDSPHQFTFRYRFIDHYFYAVVVCVRDGKVRISWSSYSATFDLYDPNLADVIISYICSVNSSDPY